MDWWKHEMSGRQPSVASFRFHHYSNFKDNLDMVEGYFRISDIYVKLLWTRNFII